MLELRGAWPEALAEARHACDRLAAPVNPAALGGACVIEGDLLRLIGDFDGAEASYRRATELGRDPQPGVALLRLRPGTGPRRRRDDPPRPRRDRGPHVASAPAQRLRRDRPRRRRHRRRARRGRRAPCDRRRARITVPAGTRRTSHWCRALGRRRQHGRAHRASRRLQRLPRTRRALRGRTHPASDRRLRAKRSATTTRPQLETSAARAVLESLGATTPSTIASRADTAADGLTPRELEVLALLAQGKTNRTIAHELYISEKTVASHVSHIFTKLGIGSRSAATAYAYDHHLV